MAELTGDPKIDALLIKHADEISSREALAKQIAEENDRLIANIEARRAKRSEVIDGK